MKSYSNSSIGRKQLVGLSGLALCLFLIGHLSGNLLIYKGKDAFNAYAQSLHDLGFLLWIARGGLILVAVTHVILVLGLVLENRRARPVKYIGKNDVGKPSLGVKTMPYTGMLLVAYIVYHISQYTFGNPTGPEAQINGDEFGLYGLVYNSFAKNPLNTTFYIVAMIVLGLHLSHGFQSAFQTIGFNHEKYTPKIKFVSYALGLLIGLGFASIPIYIFLKNPLGVAL